MTLQIDLDPELEAKLRERAAAAGKDTASFAREALEEKLRGPRTLAETLAPIHKEVEESGMPNQELDALFLEALKESRSERHKKA